MITRHPRLIHLKLGKEVPVVSHSSSVKKTSNSPEKEGTPSGVYQSLEKVKILSIPFQRHIHWPVSQDIAPPDHPNTALSSMDVQTHTPNGHSPMRIHLDFLQNVGDFSPKPPKIHLYLWNRKSLEERLALQLTSH